MIVFRILCALLVAWAANWSLSRPEAVQLIDELPEMETLGPIAGAFAGFFNLAVRQGWGVIVAIANGIWVGALSIFLAGVMFTAGMVGNAILTNVIKNFDQFLNVFGQTVEPLFEQVLNIPLLVTSLGATAFVGVVTEGAHWLLVKFKQRKGGQNTDSV